MLTTRILKENEVNNYKALLHDIYSGLNWEPPKKNPSNWRIVNEGGRNIYHDNYDQVATFFGIFADSKLIGGCRILEPLHDKLEFELYYQIPDRFILQNRIEANRFSLLPDYLNSPAALVLWIKVLDHLLERPAPPRIFLPVFSQEMIKLCSILGFQFVDRSSFFKYFPSDPNNCQLLFLDTNNREKVQEIINRCHLLVS